MRMKHRATKGRRTKVRRTNRRGGGSSSITVPWTNGQQFTKEQMVTIPSIKINDFDKSHLYTIILWDPDAPAKPGFLHYLIVNATSEFQGTIIMPYMGPNPPAGIHRYILTVYRQNGALNPSAGQRQHFDRDAWLKEHRLGKPLIETYFRVAAE